MLHYVNKNENYRRNNRNNEKNPVNNSYKAVAIKHQSGYDANEDNECNNL